MDNFFGTGMFHAIFRTKNYLSFIWSSRLSGCPVFSMVESDTPTSEGQFFPLIDSWPDTS